MSDAGRIAPGAHLLVTGGAGFIGSELVRRLLARRRRDAGHRPRQAHLRRQPRQPRRGRGRSGAGRPVRLRPGDIADPEVVAPPRRRGRRRRQRRRRDARRSLASSTRRRSSGPASSASTCCSRRSGARRRGGRRRARANPLPPGQHRRGLRRHPRGPSRRRPIRSPRAARTPPRRPPSELLVRAYHVTFGIDTVITRGSNTYGPHQHPEKLIPLFMTNALAGEPLPMYGDGMQVRDWLHVEDHAAGHRVRAATTASPARPTTWPAARSCRTAR